MHRKPDPSHPPNGNPLSANELLLQPIAIGPLTARNRLMMTTHNPKLTEARYLGYLEERVAEGPGLVGVPVLSESVSGLVFAAGGNIDPAYSSEWDAAPDPATEAGAAFYDSFLLPRLRARADIVHRHGGLCFGQLAERGAARLPETFQPRIAPSTRRDDFVRANPHELEPDEISRLVRLIARSALRVQQAGLDGVEIHAAHGYLVEQFLSPFTNHRSDRYGGSFDNRIRFLEDIMDDVRDTCGAAFPIGIRISARQQVKGGLTVEDAQRLVQRISSRLAYVNVTAGTISGLEDGVTLPYVGPWFVEPGVNADAASSIKSVSDAPVIVTGRINDPALMNRILAEGKADMIGVTRTLMADPHFMRKVASGRSDRIHKCIGANECHYPDRGSACAVNASIGREDELRFAPASKRKRVLVIGGGPAGLEAARVASLRGHTVTVLEKGRAPGGQIAVIARDPNRGEMGSHIDWLLRELQHQKVDIRLEVEGSVALIRDFAPDALVIATGSISYVPYIDGLDAAHACTALDLLGGTANVGNKVAVVGGLDDHLAPLMAAEWLADRGKQVTLLSECLLAGMGLEPATMHVALKRLLDKGIDVQTRSALVSAGRTLTVEDVFTKRRRAIEDIDTLVFACASRPENTLAKEAAGLVAETYRIGDCLAPRRLVHATLDGARIGVRL
ncbi:MAG: FAD-binding protein [Betaproteobacteria bacterium]|nr:FAD-binding protein [Betaproteobacteria bacterium]